MPSDFQSLDETRTSDSFQHDMVELLRAEVTQLEQELADRDARLAELTRLVTAGESRDEASAEAEPDTFALVSRLEQLLDELERKDQLTASLQEMLRVAEDARHAEQEERCQIEAWLGEIEHRLGQREAEWQAEIEAMRQRLDEVTAQRDRAERALSGGSGGQQAADLSQETLGALRQQVAELQQSLSAQDKEAASLEAQRCAAQAKPTAAARDEEIDQQLREERLKLAHERAELARARDELEHERRGLKRCPDEVELRVQALRDHLREIHVREQQEKKERDQHTLSSRIARLWKRLEG